MEGAIEMADVAADRGDGCEIGDQSQKLGSGKSDSGPPLQSCIKSETGVGKKGDSDARGDSPSKSKKGPRRVCFPDGGNFVTKFFEPPNPWDKAKSFTTNELVCDYKNSCEKVGVKPIPKLLNQLQAILDFGERFETLTLKGERLDVRHCETLEEVLRRVQFKTIDLEATHLDDEGAGALFDMIEYYESATKLNIAYNRSIGPRGWQACSRMLKKTPCLENLDARNCLFTEQSMPFLGRALRLGSNLTTLHLESSNLSGRPLLILVGALKLNETLKELFLADNKLMPSDGIQLGNLLKFNHRLQLLDLRNNHLQDVGTTHISDGLYEQNIGSGLTTLVFWNNQITYQSMASLARALCSTQNLETLNLGHNNITNEGIHNLKDGLLKNKSLLRLGIQASKLSCEGAIALAEYIADNKKLLRVDLRENDIKTAGLMALSLALKVNMFVSRVDIDKDPKKESGVKDYVDQQRRLHQDIQNWLQRNKELNRLREQQAELAKTMPGQEKKVEIVEVEETVNTSRPVLALPFPENRQMTLESPMYTPGSEPISSPLKLDGAALEQLNILTEEDLNKLSPKTRARKLFTVNKVDELPNASPTNFNAPLFGLNVGSDKSAYDNEQDYVESVMQAAVENYKMELEKEKYPKNLPFDDRSPLSPLASPDILESGRVTNVVLVGPDVLPTLSTSTLVTDQGSSDFVKRTIDTVMSKGPPKPKIAADSLLVDNQKPTIPSSGSMEGLLISPDEADDTVFLEDMAKKRMLNTPNENIDADGSASGKVCEGAGPDGSDMDSSERLSGASQNKSTELPSGAVALVSCDSDSAQALDVPSTLPTIITVCDMSVDGDNRSSPVDPDTLREDTPDPMDPGMDDVGDSDMDKVDLDDITLDPKDPDFHTNMTINGMTMELSKVLDSLDASATTDVKSGTGIDAEDCTSTPDEFERELDEMLAKVRQEGRALTAGAGNNKCKKKNVCEKKQPGMFEIFGAPPQDLDCSGAFSMPW